LNNPRIYPGKQKNELKKGASGDVHKSAEPTMRHKNGKITPGFIRGNNADTRKKAHLVQLNKALNLPCAANGN